jgi:hypothetical protein
VASAFLCDAWRRLHSAFAVPDPPVRRADPLARSARARSSHRRYRLPHLWQTEAHAGRVALLRRGDDASRSEHRPRSPRASPSTTSALMRVNREPSLVGRQADANQRGPLRASPSVSSLQRRALQFAARSKISSPRREISRARRNSEFPPVFLALAAAGFQRASAARRRGMVLAQGCSHLQRSGSGRRSADAAPLL